MSFPRKRESIISATYKFLDSRFRGNDNIFRDHLFLHKFNAICKECQNYSSNYPPKECRSDKF